MCFNISEFKLNESSPTHSPWYLWDCRYAPAMHFLAFSITFSQVGAHWLSEGRGARGLTIGGRGEMVKGTQAGGRHNPLGQGSRQVVHNKFWINKSKLLAGGRAKIVVTPLSLPVPMQFRIVGNYTIYLWMLYLFKPFKASAVIWHRPTRMWLFRELYTVTRYYFELLRIVKIRKPEMGSLFVIRYSNDEWL